MAVRRPHDRSASSSIFFCLSFSGPACSRSSIRRYPATTVTGVRSSCTASDSARGKTFCSAVMRTFSICSRLGQTVALCSAAVTHGWAPPVPRTAAAESRLPCPLADQSSSIRIRIETCEPVRRDADPVECEQQKIPGASPDPAVAAPSARRCHQCHWQLDEPSARDEPPHELDVLHQRHLLISPERLEHGSPDEQSLIAIRQAQHPHAQRHASLDYACLP